MVQLEMQFGEPGFRTPFWGTASVGDHGFRSQRSVESRGSASCLSSPPSHDNPGKPIPGRWLGWPRLGWTESGGGREGEGLSPRSQNLLSIPRGQETRGKTTGSEQGKTQAVDVGMKKDREGLVLRSEGKPKARFVFSEWMGNSCWPGETGCARLV